MPEIHDWDVDRVDLKWKPPKDDGGAPITGYIIEQKEKFSTSWEPVLETKVHNVSCENTIFVGFVSIASNLKS